MFELTPEAHKQHLREKLAELPDSPGVYMHKNVRGEVLYVGKAISLKNRVRSYFQSPKNHPPRTRALVANIADFSYILTDSETEALTLESNLIKAKRPRYNILLKDDKTFPYVRMDAKKPFPRVELTYKLRNDGAKYFGPYLSRYAVREALETVRDIFPLRTCKKDIERAIARGERPCLNFHIGKCIAPCSGQVDSAHYREIVEQVARFLDGDTDTVIARLRVDMARASDDMQFEKAAQIRDRIRAITLISEKQKAIAANTDERDVFAFARLGVDSLVYALFVRGGRIVATEHYSILASDDSPEDVMNSFLKQFYGEGAYIPKEVALRDLPPDADAIAGWLSERRGNKVTIAQPRRGDKKKLCDMAHKNALETLEKALAGKRREWERSEGALRDLATALGLDELPQRIEAFDISHTAGTDPVASMVVFIDGKAANKLYRRFRIKTATNDDYASMREVLTRRFTRAIESRAAGRDDEWAAMPGLLLIDGGKGQLNTAIAALHELTLYEGEDLAVAGLAERLEELFVPGQSEPILLETGSPALHLLQRVRDEAHRFAISYHRSLRQKNALFSLLDEIPGIGPRRRKALFQAFVSLDAIRAATEEDLRNAPGMDKRSAQAVFRHFHPDGDPEPLR